MSRKSNIFNRASDKTSSGQSSMPPIINKDAHVPSHTLENLIRYIAQNKGDHTIRTFSLWCAEDCIVNIKPIQHQLLSTARQYISGIVQLKMLEKWYLKTESMAVATDTVGLQHKSADAAAFMVCRETVNPDAAESALHAAFYHQLWESWRNASEIQPQKVHGVDQKQTNKLLDLMNGNFDDPKG